MKINKTVTNISLAIVILALSLMTVSTWAAEQPVATQNDKTQQIGYPPYPGVWGAELPVSENVHFASIDIIKMPDGDYKVIYVEDREYLKNREAKAFDLKRDKVGMFVSFSFFASKKNKFSSNEEFNDFMKKQREENKIIKEYPMTPIVFSDGSSIKKISEMHPKGSNPFDWYLERKDKNGKVLLQKKLLYIYDKPVKKRTPLAERNFDYRGKYYDEKVNWPRQLIYFPLEDETFLIVGFLQYHNPPSIIIVRFDKDFKTKSDLVGRKVFLFDEGIYKKMKRPLDDQAANDYFYNYLIKIRKKN